MINSACEQHESQGSSFQIWGQGGQPVSGAGHSRSVGCPLWYPREKREAKSFPNKCIAKVMW